MTDTQLFRVGGLQARFVATVVGFYDAWNAGDVDEALTFVTDDVVGGDCEYAAARRFEWRNRTELATWLRERAADHDRLMIDGILNENPDPSTGSHVVGVTFASREGDALRNVGRARMRPPTVAKLVFAQDGHRLRAIAMVGSSCQLPTT